MDDLMKSKTVFIISFLAALLAMYPIVQEYGHLGVTILGVNVTVKVFYLINTGLLGLSVYFFSLGYTSEKSFKIIRVAGNTLYSLAVLWPIVFVLFYITTLIIFFIFKLINSQIISSITSSILSILVILLAHRILKFIKDGVNSKDKQSLINKMLISESINLEIKNGTLMEKVQMFYDKEIYDPVVIFCFSALIMSLKMHSKKVGIM